MKQVVIYAIVGIACGLGAGTVGTVIGAKRHASPAADSTAVFVDSTKAPHGTATVDSHAVADTAAAIDSATHHDSTDTAAHKAVAGAARAATPVDTTTPTVVRAVLPAPAVRDDSGSARLARLGKLFAAMSPRDAAKVLGQLSDVDVHEILGKLSDRQAATILAAFPADRAAAITKLALRRGVGGGE